ncbi:MAG: cupin domain-containing protein [Propionibacteriales bacterium]|nr:cupin domain-containing protein [Propionibacteriales bacterium]
MPVLSPAAPMDPFPGSRFTQLATPSRGSTRTSVWQIEIQPGTPAVTHQLTAEEIFIVLGGNANVTLADVVTPARTGDAIVVPADTDFALDNSGDTPLSLICVFPVGGQARTCDGAVFTPPWAQ